MNALVCAAPAVSTNHAHYDAAMNAAKLVGQNFGTLAKNMRTLAVELVRASKVEGFALQEAITDAKSKMKWTRLDSKDQNRVNQVFRDVRTIDGAWALLSPEGQDAFLKGEKTPSTLAAEIRKAESDKLEAEAKAEADAEQADAERAKPVNDDGSLKVAEQLAEQAPSTLAALQTVLDLATKVAQNGVGVATADELVGLNLIWEQIENLRASMAKPAKAA